LENRVFKLKSAKEKIRQLAEILKNKTKSSISNRMIKRIINRVLINNQYYVYIFSDRSLFWQEVNNAKTGCYLACTDSRFKRGPISAVISFGAQTGLSNNTGAIYIYSPYLSKAGEADHEKVQ
jgi:hypothetical protein